MVFRSESNKDKESSQKIKVSRKGPYLVSGGIPLIQEEIRDDSEGYCHSWYEIKQYPLNETYALCRCGHSGNKPFCDGTHTKINFDGTETAGNEPYEEGAKVIKGPGLILTDKKNLCVHARFCLSAGGIRNLIMQSDNPEAKEKAIEEAANCPSGRLVVYDKKTGKAIEPEFEKSIVVTEYPSRWEYGPLWVRGSIPIESANGKIYETRNRVTLCRCGKSQNKPFCDDSHVINKQ